MAYDNTIALAQKFLPLLDEAYRLGALTSILDAQDVVFTGAKTIKVYKMTMDGLGNYGRNTGFVDGAVTGEWEEKTLEIDRGRSFQIDRMDNEESLDMAFGRAAGKFLRDHVIPEVDAYTFSKMAGFDGVIKGTAADIEVGVTDVPTLIDEAQYQMDEAEVPTEGRLLFMSNSAYAGLKPKITRALANEGTVNREVEVFNDMRVIKVPQGRFNTAITLQDGSSGGQTAGGFKPTAGSYKINFMIVHPSAILKVVKHAIPRIFSPDVNQQADAWKFDYRIYHDVFAYDEKVKGIYLHQGSTANQ